MEALKISLLCIGAAIAYGIVHDQITVRICLEYFSLFHPTILPLTSPTLLAFQWGIVATWWVGAGLGIPLAVAARAGTKAPLGVRDLYRPICILLICMAVGAAAAGTTGFLLAQRGVLSTHWLDSMLPREMHGRFIADWWTHTASYAVGIVGGLILCVTTYIRRGSSDGRPRHQ